MRTHCSTPTALKRLVVLNRDIFVRTLCLLSSFGWFAHLGARQGDATLAANALLLNFQTFMAYGLDGFAHAAEALVGAAIGARDRHAFAQAVKVTALWSALGALGFALVYWGAGSWIVERLTDQAAVRAAAETYLPWAALSPVISVWGFLLDGVFIGATRTRELMLSMIVSLARVRRGVVGLAGAARQSRPVGRDDDLHGRTRRHACALSAGRHAQRGVRECLSASHFVSQHPVTA